MSSHRLISVVALLGCAAGTNAARSQASASAAPLSADAVPVHDTFTIWSKEVGEARPINVHAPSPYRPANDAPPRPLPVLYMPDGGLDEDFPHVVRAVDSLTAMGAIPRMLVVGIPNTQRRRDLTGPTRVHSDSAIAPRVGGSAAFRRFVAGELIPEIERRYRTTGERAIIGESLAGLFIVETFLEEPALFAHYIALDPSLWWNKGALADSAARRIAAMGAGRRTLYLASSEEPGTYIGAGRIASALRAAPPPGLRVTYEPRPDLTHGNIFRSLEARALVDSFR